MKQRTAAFAIPTRNAADRIGRGANFHRRPEVRQPC